jgi:hypothetical protein
MSNVIKAMVAGFIATIGLSGLVVMKQLMGSCRSLTQLTCSPA